MPSDKTVEVILHYLWLVLLYLKKAAIATGMQLLILLAPALLLASIMNILAGFIEKRAYRLMGQKFYLILIGWLGTIVHELSHALFCVIFRHRIVEMKIFNIDQEKGTVGYVSHEFESGNIYQRVGNFFIGIAPVLVGTLAIFVASRFLLGASVFHSLTTDEFSVDTFTSLNAFGAYVSSVFKGSLTMIGAVVSVERLSDWKFYLFLYIAFSVGSSITLSGADLRGAFNGFIFLVILCFLCNVATIWMGDILLQAAVMLSKFYSVFSGVMLFAIIMNLFVAMIILTILGAVDLLKRSLGRNE
jgi:hypothetical protein